MISALKVVPCDYLLVFRGYAATNCAEVQGELYASSASCACALGQINLA